MWKPKLSSVMIDTCIELKLDKKELDLLIILHKA